MSWAPNICGYIVRRTLCGVCWLTFQMPSFFSLPSEFITPEKGTNSDLRPAPVGSAELRREIHLGGWGWSSLKVVGSSVTAGSACLGKPLLTREGGSASLYPAVFSFSLHKYVLLGTFWTRCVALCVLPHASPTIAPFHTLQFPFYTTGNMFFMWASFPNAL